MKVTIVGGWSDDGSDTNWGAGVASAKREACKSACRAIGKRLAERGHTIVVGSAERFSADYHVVKGFLSARRSGKSPVPRIHLIEGIGSEREPYAAERRAPQYRALFLGVPANIAQNQAPRAAEKILATSDADALIAIGGRADTYTAGIAALMAKKVVIPIASFGGAAFDLWRAARMLGNVAHNTDFMRLSEKTWDPAVLEAAMRFGGLERPRVFLVSSGRSHDTAWKICRYLERLGFDVCFWSRDFQLGQVILDEIRAASYACKYAVVLLTPDDLLHGPSKRWLPRGNVLFELGYFLNALGKERTIVIAQEGVEIPADYSGHIYAQFRKRTQLSEVREKLKKALSRDLPPRLPDGKVLVLRAPTGGQRKGPTRRLR